MKARSKSKYDTKEWDIKIIEACKKHPLSMASACSYLNMNLTTFSKHAKRLGVYKPNQSGKGTKKRSTKGYKLEDILNNKHPQYSTYKLKNKLFEEGKKKEVCEVCKNTEWNSLKIPLELHHIDGNSSNHSLKNLKVLCPNCHAQTDTYCARNKK